MSSNFKIIRDRENDSQKNTLTSCLTERLDYPLDYSVAKTKISSPKFSNANKSKKCECRSEYGSRLCCGIKSERRTARSKSANIINIMLATKCNQDNLNKFKHKNANQLPISNDKQTAFASYSNSISDYKKTDLVLDDVSNDVSNENEAAEEHETKLNNKIELKDVNETGHYTVSKSKSREYVNYEIDRIYCEHKSNESQETKNRHKLGEENSNDLLDLEAKKNEKQNVSIDKCSQNLFGLSPTNELNNVKNSIENCSNLNQADLESKSIQTKSNEQTNSNTIQHPETSAQSNQHQSSSLPVSSQPTHSNHENHSVHFATKNDKLPSISIGHFSVYLDRLDYEYRPSDILTGKLHILLESGQLNMNRIVIYLKGISSVKFTEREYQSTSQNEKHFEDVEYWSDHFLMELKTRPKLNNLRVLDPGEYHLPFKFTFPTNGIPSSFESTFGYIRYWIYCEIRSKDKNRDLKEKETNDDDSNIATSELPVEVYAPCSIPVEELRRPINAEQLKVMGCLGCCTCLFRNPDFIQVRANIMHQGQRKGTSVQVNLFVVNRSRKQIQPYVILKARNEYRATNKTKINEVELNGCPGAIVNSGETNMQTILIPLKHEYPIIYDSPNIMISYRVKILIEIPNSFDINFPQLPIYLVNEKFPLRQHNFVQQ